MKVRTLLHIGCGLTITGAIFAALVCPAPNPGTAPVNPPVGGFGIDGDLLSNTPTAGIGDWLPGPQPGPTPGGNVLTAAGCPINASTTFHLTDLANSGNDNNFKGGLKADDDPNTWSWVTNPVLGKDDIRHGLIHTAKDPVTGHTWIIIAATRESNNGDSYIDFEFLQGTLGLTTKPDGKSGGFTSSGPNCGRTVNDFILTVNFTQGGSQAGLCVSRWMASSANPCGFDYVNVTSMLKPNTFFAAANSANITVPNCPPLSGSNTYSANSFAEAAVDLTELLNSFNPCLGVSINTLFVKTKTSQSANATIVDFIAPQPITLVVGPTANAGADQTKCSEGDSTTFNITGTATAGDNSIASMKWSVVAGSGSATIDPPDSCQNCMTLPATVHVTSQSVKLLLTVTDSLGCVETDEVMLTVKSSPACGISGPSPLCPTASGMYSGPDNVDSYFWSISGDGSFASGGPHPTTKDVTVIAGSDCGTFTLSLQVTKDGCTSDCPVKIVGVTDTTAPVISTLPGPSTIACPATPSFATPTATDNCPGAVTLTFVDETTPGSCPQAYTVKRTWTATDHCGNSSNKSQTINVVDSVAPVISTLPGPSTIACPATPSFATPTASDACDPSPTLTFVDATTPGNCPQAFSVTRTWTATDHCGNHSSSSQTINVSDTTAPVISALPGPTTIACPATPVFTTPTATDACDSSPTLTFADVTTPGNCPQNFSVTRTWTATDHCGNHSSSSQTINVSDTTAPVISALPGPTTIACPATPVFTTPTATDACDSSPTLTFADVTTPGNCPQNFSVTRTWTATDHCGNHSSSSQTINVSDTTAPVISALPGPTTIACPATPVFTTPTATDACDSSPTLTFADVTTPGNCPQNFSVTRTWTATDHCGNHSSSSQTINVVDSVAPVISTLPAPSTIACPATPSFATPTASDACDPSPTLTFVDATTPGNCPQAFSVTRTWTATDHCGNHSSASQTISVTDTTGPVITLTGGQCGGSVTQACNTTPQFPTATANDNCDGNLGAPQANPNPVPTTGPAFYYVDSAPTTDANGNTSYVRTWHAIDSCGNHETTSCNFTVIIPPCGGCPTPVTSSITSNFNGTSISPSNYIWFNANFKASGIQNGTIISFTNSSLDIVLSNGTHILQAIPDGIISFSSNVTCATTTFSGGKWMTTVPVSGSDEIFLSGLLVKAGNITSSDLKGATVTWTGDFSTSTSGLTLSWKWGAAVYQANTTVANAAANPNLIGVKPTHTNACNINGSDHAGTPMNLKKSVIGGARGGGGSNFTGSWSGTNSVAPCVNTPAGSASMSASSMQSSSATIASNVCPPTGSLRTLTMTYEGRNAGGGTVTGNPGGLDAAYIVVTAGSSSLFSGAVSFNSRTNPGSAYFVIDGGNAPLPQQATVTIYTARGGAKVSTVSFDTSCKQPINVGDYFGSLRVSTGSQ